MNIFRQLTEMPWLTDEGTVVELHDGRVIALPTAKLGLRVFLVVVGVVFSLLVAAYADRMVLGDWRPLPEPWLLWLNTAVLILSSVAFHRARGAANQGRRDGVRMWLRAAGVLAIAFLAGQLLAWQQLAALGYFAATNPANSFFYLLTALHGLHMMGGLVAWGRTSAKVRRGVELSHVRMSVDMCTTYWHFLLAIWLILFTLVLLT